MQKDDPQGIPGTPQVLTAFKGVRGYQKKEVQLITVLEYNAKSFLFK